MRTKGGRTPRAARSWGGLRLLLPLAMMTTTGSLLSGALGAPAGAAGVTYYASATGNPNNGCTQTNPCSLQTALNKASTGGDTVDLLTGAFLGTYHISPTLQLGPGGTSPTEPVTIQPGPEVLNPTLDGDGNVSILHISASSYVTLRGLTFEHGNSETGGAITNNSGGNLTIEHCSFLDNNAASVGGAIDNADAESGGGSGSISITDSTFSGNTAGLEGGAIASARNGLGSLSVTRSTFAGNQAGSGGAIYEAQALGQPGQQNTVSVSDSTFVGNQATAALGGAILNVEPAENQSGRSAENVLTVSNSTFASNSSSYSAGGGGGAIANGTFGIDSGGNETTVVKSTFSHNTNAGSANDLSSMDGDITLGADVVADTCNFTSFSQVVNDEGYNIENTHTAGQSCTNGGTGDITSSEVTSLSNPKNFGGPTQTIALLPNNPAVARIPATQGSFCPVTASDPDQRDYVRPAGTYCNAGAVQLVASTTSLTVSPSPVVPGQPVTITATVSRNPGPTGTVVFLDGSTVLATENLDPTTGQAVYRGVLGTTRPHTIEAIYSGDRAPNGDGQYNYTASRAVIHITAEPRQPSTTTVTSAPATTTFGDTDSITATVAPSSATGTVTFTDVANGTSTTLGAEPLSGGSATWTGTLPAVGDNVVTATYSGDASYAPSTSNPVTVAVAATPHLLIVSQVRFWGPVPTGPQGRTTPTLTCRTPRARPSRSKPGSCGPPPGR